MSILLAPRAEHFATRTAIIAPEGEFTYRQLLDASARVAAFLLKGQPDLEERPVAFMAPPGFHYLALQWGIWRAGGIAVPLCHVPSTGRSWNMSWMTPPRRRSWPTRSMPRAVAPLAEARAYGLRLKHRGPAICSGGRSPWWRRNAAP